jgi:ABC-type phosphate/phosphonate transport system substrate-binding protein
VVYRLSYYPWLTQNVPPAEIDRQIRIFAREIAQELKSRGHPDAEVSVLPPVDVPEQIDQVASGRCEIALMNPLGFVFARERSRTIEAIAVALRIIDGKVGSTYFAQLYTSKKTAIRSLPQVRGRSLAFGLPYSTSNFLIPAEMLRQAGVHPLTAPGRVEFLKGHEIVARAVYEGRVDVGAGHDGVIVDLANQPGYGDAEEVLVRLARSNAIPSDPIVTTLGTDLRRPVQEALIAAASTPDGSNALKVFWGNTQGLAPTTGAKYDILSQALKSLALDAAAILPPSGR